MNFYYRNYCIKIIEFLVEIYREEKLIYSSNLKSSFSDAKLINDNEIILIGDKTALIINFTNNKQKTIYYNKCFNCSNDTIIFTMGKRTFVYCFDNHVSRLLLNDDKFDVISYNKGNIVHYNENYIYGFFPRFEAPGIKKLFYIDDILYGYSEFFLFSRRKTRTLTLTVESIRDICHNSKFLICLGNEVIIIVRLDRFEVVRYMFCPTTKRIFCNEENIFFDNAKILIEDAVLNFL